MIAMFAYYLLDGLSQYVPRKQPFHFSEFVVEDTRGSSQLSAQVSCENFLKTEEAASQKK